MKKFSYLLRILDNTWIVLSTLLIIISSCTGDDNGSMEIPTGTPVVAEIRIMADNTLAEEGSRGVLYNIKGQHLLTTRKIVVNGEEAYFNPNFVTNTNIILRIPDTTPFSNDESGSLVIETDAGSFTYNFRILQPPPTVASFSPISGNVGDELTITGDVFDNLASVSFGDSPAEIISADQQRIVVKVPENAQGQNIIVTTSGGSTISSSPFGFRYVIYQEGFNPELTVSPQGWDGDIIFDSQEQVRTGNLAIKKTITGGYAGGGFNIDSGAIPLNDYTNLNLSVYSDTTREIVVLINWNFDGCCTYQTQIEGGVWTDLSIPFSELGSPGEVFLIMIQEFSGQVDSNIYIDDIGLL